MLQKIVLDIQETIEEIEQYWLNDYILAFDCETTLAWGMHASNLQALQNGMHQK